MRPIRLTVNAAGNSQWVPISYLNTAFAIGLNVLPWSTATAPNYTVQHTLDDLQATRPITITRAAAVATVTDLGPDGLGHGLVTGDNVIVTGCGAPFDTLKATIGIQHGDLGADITVTGNTTYTYAVANSGPTVDNGSAKVVSLRVNPHATLVGLTVRADGNYAFPIRACRLKVNTLSAGAIDFLILQGASAT